jgi:hypothetical protein
LNAAKHANCPLSAETSPHFPAILFASVRAQPCFESECVRPWVMDRITRSQPETVAGKNKVEFRPFIDYIAMT